jgi:SpoVK/Ycf46/Vps4 family AAA+-type ATPase
MDNAILAALEEKRTTARTKDDTLTVKARHFEVALTKVRPSVSEKVSLILLNFFHACNLIPFLLLH